MSCSAMANMRFRRFIARDEREERFAERARKLRGDVEKTKMFTVTRAILNQDVTEVTLHCHSQWGCVRFLADLNTMEIQLLVDEAQDVETAFAICSAFQTSVGEVETAFDPNSFSAPEQHRHDEEAHAHSHGYAEAGW